MMFSMNNNNLVILTNHHPIITLINFNNNTVRYGRIVYGGFFTGFTQYRYAGGTHGSHRSPL